MSDYFVADQLETLIRMWTCQLNSKIIVKD